MMFERKAQGTSEYLMLLSIVVVIGLVVVILFSNFFSSSDQILAAKNKQDSVSGPIGFVESVADPEGDALFSVKNNSSDTLYITKVAACGNDTNFWQKLASGDEKIFSVSGLTGNCDCTGFEGKTREFNVTVFAQTKYGLERRYDATVIVDCVEDAQAEDPTSLATTSRTIRLDTPSNNSTASDLDINFTYSVTAPNTADISSCELIVDGVVEATQTGPPYTSFNYEFQTEGTHTWDVNCTDNGAKEDKSLNGPWIIIYSGEVPVLEFDGGDGSVEAPYQISDCNQLQNAGSHLSSNFVLINDINCYTDTREGGILWNDGAGFEPIGGFMTGTFSGIFNGNGHKIFGLHIYLPEDYSPALFGNTSGAKIMNLGVVDINVTGLGFSGASPGSMIGTADSSTIENSFVTGAVYSQGAVGGMIGWAFSNTPSYVINSYSDVALYGAGYFAGGLCGANCVIINSYSIGDSSVSGGSDSGGLVGVQPVFYDYSKHSITNSFSTGELASSKNGGVVSQDSNNPITNSYWYNSAPDCVYLNPPWSVAPDGMTCTKADGASDFYNILHDVYAANEPYWTFSDPGTDANWSNICNGVGYPSLMWEGITNPANCRT